jgi:hypothetical protein
VENDSYLDPSETMLIKRILSVASGYAALKTFIDSNISVIGADDALSGEWYKISVITAVYISRDFFLSQMFWLSLVSTWPLI